MAVLALDLGLDCGWCLWRAGDAMSSGVKRFRDLGPDRVRYRAFRLWLETQRRELEAAGEKLNDVTFEYIDFVPKEARRHQGLHTYGAFRGLLLAWCETNGIADRPIAWDVVKLHVTGHRSAAKPLVTKRIQQLFPNVVDHNEADAVAVMLTAQNKFAHQAPA